MRGILAIWVAGLNPPGRKGARRTSRKRKGGDKQLSFKERAEQAKQAEEERKVTTDLPEEKPEDLVSEGVEGKEGEELEEGPIRAEAGVPFKERAEIVEQARERREEKEAAEQEELEEGPIRAEAGVPFKERAEIVERARERREEKETAEQEELEEGPIRAEAGVPFKERAEIVERARERREEKEAEEEIPLLHPITLEEFRRELAKQRRRMEVDRAEEEAPPAEPELKLPEPGDEETELSVAGTERIEDIVSLSPEMLRTVETDEGGFEDEGEVSALTPVALTPEKPEKTPELEDVSPETADTVDSEVEREAPEGEEQPAWSGLKSLLDAAEIVETAGIEEAADVSPEPSIELASTTTGEDVGVEESSLEALFSQKEATTEGPADSGEEVRGPEIGEDVAVEESSLEALFSQKETATEEPPDSGEEEDGRPEFEEIDPRGELAPSELIGKILEIFLIVLSEEQAKSATPENITLMKRQLSSHYAHLRRTLGEKGFSLETFPEELPDEDIETAIRSFIQTLARSYLLFAGTRHLRKEHPEHFKEIEELEDSFRDLSSIEQARREVVRKRTEFQTAPPAPAVLILERMIESFQSILAEEESKPASSENILNIRRRFNDFYAHARRALAKKGFLLGGFRKHIPDEELDATLRRFIHTLAKSYLLFMGYEHLKAEYPQYLQKIEELGDSFKDLSRVEEARELLIRKRAELNLPVRGADALFLKEMIIYLGTLLSSERSKPGTLENVIRMRARLREAYSKSLDKLREEGFVVAELGDIPEQQTEERFAEFVDLLRELLSMGEELNLLWDKYPRYASEIEELGAILKDLSRLNESKTLITEKRTVFTLRTLIEDYETVTREFEQAKGEIREIEEIIVEKDFDLFLVEIERFKKKYFVEPPQERELKLSEFASRLEERGLLGNKTILEKLKALYPQLFEQQIDTLELDLGILDMINSTLEKRKTGLQNTENYRNIEKHRNDPSFLFLTLKRFMEMELDSRAKILGK